MVYQSQDIPSPRRNGWIFFGFIAILCYVETFLLPVTLTQYDLARIMKANEYHRLLTGHFAHTNTFHFCLNMSALCLVALLHQHYYRWWQWYIGGLLIAIGTSALLLLFDKDTEYYLGLSGLLHGLLAMGIATDMKHKLPSGSIFLVLLISKLFFEQFLPPNYELEALIESYVAINAHAIGSCLGFVVGVIFASVVYSTPKNLPPDSLTSV